MEKKKILLVAVSVGIFLVIAIGAAILIFSPRSGVSANTVVMERSNQHTYPDPVETVPVYPRTADPETDYQNPAAPGYQNSPVSPNNTAIQENNFYINDEGQRQPYYTDRTEDRTNTRTTTPQIVISVPRPEGTAVPVLPEKSGDASKPAASTAKPAAPAKSAAPAPAKSAAPPKSATPPKTASAAKPAATARTNYDAYWVQAGSFSTKVHADGVKETLASKGIISIIENRDVEGKTFYRVRIGPYTSQNEADYWLALIQTLDGFEGSQVWKSQVQKLN
jgi:DedD protein